MRIKIAAYGEVVELDSPEEALFYGLCCFHEIHVKRPDPARAAIGGYCPGFYVNVSKSTSYWVEVADGERDAELRPLRAAWRERVHLFPLAVLYREELNALRGAAGPAQFAARLRQSAR